MSEEQKNEMSDDEKLAKIRELVTKIDIGMLTTIDENGDLHSRPMSVNGEVEFDGDLWFFTYGSSHKASEIEGDQRVNVSFSQAQSQTYVSLSGNAKLVRDADKISEIWQPSLKAWFPDGVETNDIALLKVEVEKAQYWDSSGEATAYVVGIAKGVVAHEPAKDGENEKVDLK